jgi:autophagy-related protein 101
MRENIVVMEQRRPPEYIIEVFADPSSVKDVVRGTLFTATEGRETERESS